LSVQSDITLCTINARYIHASLGLRCLYANMGLLQERTTLTEFTLAQRAEDIVEQLLHPHLNIIGFGVYIWNVSLTTEVIRLVKIIRPDIKIIIGGPEVSAKILSIGKQQRGLSLHYPSSSTICSLRIDTTPTKILHIASFTSRLPEVAHSNANFASHH